MNWSIIHLSHFLLLRHLGLYLSFYLGVLTAVFGCNEAVAQDTPQPQTDAPQAQTEIAGQIQSENILSYTPEFFADARPSSAFDMIQRIPGFSYDGGNNNIRGFAGSSGNVLVDGAAPSTKSISLSDFLRRIPPENVERIDLIRGGAPGIDMQGQSVLANIIQRDAASTTGSVRVQANFFGGTVGRSLQADMSRRDSTLTVSGNLEIANEKNNFGSSTAAITRLDSTGAIRDSGPQIGDHYNRDYKGALTLESHYNPGTIIANIGVDLSKDNNRDTTIRTTPLGITSTSLNTEVSKHDEFEASLDYQRDIGPIRFHALALKNYQVSSDASASVQSSGNSASNTKTETGESIIRSTFAGDYSDWLTIETGAEGAINSRYQGQTQLIGGAVLTVPNSNVRIEEKRGELFSTANVVFSPDFRTEFGVRYEASTIKQSGDTNKSKFFSFVKPRVIFTYDVTDTTQLRMRVEREVGQLNFGSFVASSDLVNGTVTAGNPNLEPERSWVYEGVIDQRFWSKGAFTATFTHSEVEAINDRIPIYSPTGVFDAPGNIGRGTRDRVKLELSIPLDSIGLVNGTLKPNVNWRDSKVTDPLTGVTRRSSGDNLINGGFTYTQDINALNSTLTVNGRFESARWSYRLRELSQSGQDFQLDVSWDWKITPDLLLNVRAQNFLPRERFRNRTFYSISRGDGTISGYENSITPFEPSFDISLRQSF